MDTVAAIVSENVLGTDAPVESVILMVTFGAPVAGGVPVNWPVSALIDSHGVVPEVIAHVYGGVPPGVGVTVKLYG